MKTQANVSIHNYALNLRGNEVKEKRHFTRACFKGNLLSAYQHILMALYRTKLLTVHFVIIQKGKSWTLYEETQTETTTENIL